MTGTTTRWNAQRVAALAVLLVAGVLSLPVTAALLDGDDTDALVVPVQLVAMAALGALVGRLLPGLAGDSRRSPVLLGAAAGVAAALVGVLVFFVLVSGLDGA